MPQWYKESTCQCKRCELDPWVRKISWGRRWQPTPVFLLGKPHGLRDPVGYSPRDSKWVRQDLATKQQQSSDDQTLLPHWHPLVTAVCARLHCNLSQVIDPVTGAGARERQWQADPEGSTCCTSGRRPLRGFKPRGALAIDRKSWTLFSDSGGSEESRDSRRPGVTT